MSDYIKREDAIAEIKDAFTACDCHHDEYALVGRINFIPDVDVEPVRHGQWVRTGQSYINPNKFLCLTCSCCLSDLDEHIRKEPRYCPNCGARMDGGNNE